MPAISVPWQAACHSCFCFTKLTSNLPALHSHPLPRLTHPPHQAPELQPAAQVHPAPQPHAVAVAATAPLPLPPALPAPLMGVLQQLGIAGQGGAGAAQHAGQAWAAAPAQPFGSGHASMFGPPSERVGAE